MYLVEEPYLALSTVLNFSFKREEGKYSKFTCWLFDRLEVHTIMNQVFVLPGFFVVNYNEMHFVFSTFNILFLINKQNGQ